MVWASGGLEGGGERLAPKAGAGVCLCPPELPSVYSRCAEKLPGLSARLGASTEPQGPWQLWAEVSPPAHSWAVWLGALPRVPFYGHLCRQGPRRHCACQHRAGSFILLWKRDVANAPQPPSWPATCLLPATPGSSTVSACSARGWGCWRN